MRVLMITWEYPPLVVGGLARHVHGLATALAQRGVQVDVVTRAGGNGPAVEGDGRLTVHRVAPYFGHALDFPGWVMHLNFALAEAGVRLLLAAEGPVLIHAHDWLAAYAGRLLKHAFALPLVATVHATEHGRMRGLHHAGHKYIHDVEWWLTYEAWRVIVCSRAMAQEVQRLFSVPADKLHVIPNGIPVSDGAAPAGGGPWAARGGAGRVAAEPGAPEPGGPPGAPRAPAGPLPPGWPPRDRYARPEERVVFHLGRLVPEKGAGVLLEAFPEVLAAFPHAKLVIGGTGPWEAEVRERVAALGLEHKVLLTGYLRDEERAALLAYADVFVVPSTYEPFGIVALEAMAAGVPLVVSDTGGLSELVEHGVDGRKAIPGHPGSLADQIKQVLADPAAARRMAEAARRKVLAQYTWERVADQTLAVYQQVLDQWRGSPWGRPAVAGGRAAAPGSAAAGDRPTPVQGGGSQAPAGGSHGAPRGVPLAPGGDPPAPGVWPGTRWGRYTPL